MDRRTALFSTFALGGLLARGVRAQQPLGRSRTTGGDAPEPEFSPGASDRASGAGQFNEPDHRWRIFNIEGYSQLPHSKDTVRPEAAIVEWILRTTGNETWHGQTIAALNANSRELRAYHNLETLEKATEIVKRFVDAVFDLLTVRVRVVVAADTRWRYAVYSQLQPKTTGPMGQQVWLLDLGTAEMALAQMGISQNFRKVYDQRHKMVNGQTLFVKTSSEREYYAGLDRASVSSLGYEPKVSKLEEGVEVRLSPLLNYDGTGIDLALDLKASVIRKLHSTKVIAPRKIGPAEMNVDVPEFGSTRMNQTITGWPLDRTLVISAGVLPGILQENGGFMANLRIPGIQPNSNELLVLLDVSTNLNRGRDPNPDAAEEEELTDDPIVTKPARPTPRTTPVNRRGGSSDNLDISIGDEDLDPRPSGFRPVNPPPDVSDIDPTR